MAEVIAAYGVPTPVPSDATRRHAVRHPFLVDGTGIAVRWMASHQVHCDMTWSKCPTRH